MLAHIREDGKTQTIKEHLLSVAELGKAKGSQLRLGNTIFLIGLLHDMGKFTNEFQNYLIKASVDSSLVRRGSVNHSSAGAKFIYEEYAEKDKLVAQIVSLAIAMHHGLNDCIDIEGNNKFKSRIEPTTDIYYHEALHNMQKEILKDFNLDNIFNESIDEIQTICNKIIESSKLMEVKDNSKFMLGCLERIILSILIDSDYTDTSKFTNDIYEKEYTDKKNNEIWSLLQKNLEKKLLSFTSTDKISKLRNKMSMECLDFAKRPTGIYQLSIPTGGGKTYASLRYALEHSKLYKKKRIIYVAPFLSILEQNADAFREALEADEYILEHHSNIVLKKDEITNLNKGKSNDNEDYMFNSLTSTWNSPIILTTMVRLLNILFSDNKQDIRRMHRLANSVIIFDEIQSLPIKCVSLFNSMANFLSRVCNTTIILCSATQPRLDTVEKKILYTKPIHMIGNINDISKEFKRTTIIDKTRIQGYITEELGNFVVDILEESSDCLIILNTKNAVQSLYHDLENRDLEDIEIVQLTTYMCPKHRSDMINSVKEKLRRGERVICISTQLIEAGVDISFETVVRSLAGLDNIIQAAGRCNRNGQKDSGNVYIVNYKEEKIEKLVDIKESQEILMPLLHSFKLYSDTFDYDLLSQKTITYYYDEYFYHRKKYLDYPSKKKDSKLSFQLYDLLATNRIGRQAYRERNGKSAKIGLSQAFLSAGKEFKVIDSNTIGLIVYYKDSEKIIDSIRNSYEIGYIKKQLKKLQQYTVNIHKNSKIIKDLIGLNAIDNSLLDGRILILREEYYDEIVGIHTELKVLFDEEGGF